MKTPMDRAIEVTPARVRRWTEQFGSYRHQVTEQSIRAWLDQFRQPDRDTAARILDAVDFYNHARIAAAYRQALEVLPGWHLDPTRRQGRWKFAGMGSSAGESGDRMLHEFRLANRLTGNAHKDLFCYLSDLVQLRLGVNDTLVLLDDFVGTGDQVCATWSQSIEELVAGVGTIYLVVVVGARDGRARIEQETDMSMLPMNELNASDNLFDDHCSHFTREEKAAILRYCNRADREAPRGYGECGLLTIMQHRTPDDTIPILHARSARWTGLFPRDD